MSKYECGKVLMFQIYCKILSFGILIRGSCCFMKVLRLKISLIVDLEGPDWDEEKKKTPIKL